MAIVVVGDEAYGVQRFVCSFIQALVEQGAEPVVIALQPGAMFQSCVAAGAEGVLCDAGAPPDFGSVLDAARVGRHTVRSVRLLAAILKRIEPDAVFVRTSYLVPLVAFASRLARAASFWLLPNIISDRYPLSINKLTYDVLMRACGMVPIANSQFTRTSLLNLFSPSRVAHLGINPDEFDPAMASRLHRRDYGWAEGDAVFGIFARLVPNKGQKLFIEAVAARRDAYSDLRLLVCGGPIQGSYFEDLQRTIADHQIGARIVFTGPVADVQAHYGLCDVVVSVRLDPEPFGLSVIEGMLMERPALVHALGGPAETVADQTTGWHIQAATLEGFTAGLDVAFTDRARWTAMGRTARQHALAHFTHRDATRRILAIVSQTAGGDRDE